MNEDLKRIARRRVKARLGLYVHAAVYVAVNAVLFLVQTRTTPGVLSAVSPLTALEFTQALVTSDSGDPTQSVAGQILLRARDRDPDPDSQAARLDDAAGPPLCTVEGFDYRSGTRTLAPGDTLCLFTDGVVDAVNRSGQRFGAQALETAIVTASGGHSAAEQVVNAVREALRAFADGADPVDDCTLLVLRWKGP